MNSLEEFNQWLGSYGLVAGPGDDSDGDSISNAIEYVIGGNPANRPDANLMPTVTLVSADLDGIAGNENYLLFTYRRTHLANADPATAIRVEWCASLAGPWADANTTSGVVPIVDHDFDPGVDRVRVYIPRSLAANGKLFARLGVTITLP